MPNNGEFAHNPRTLLHIAEQLREQGISPVEIFRRVDVSPSALLDANGWVPRDLCFALTEMAGTIMGDHNFISKVGQSFQLEELGTWGKLITEAADVLEACNVAADSVGLLQQGTNLRVQTFRHRAELRFGYRGHLGADPTQHLIGTLAVIRKIALLANVPEAVSVHFSMPYSRGAASLEETHGPLLEFGCDYDAIVIDREILDMPVKSGCERDVPVSLEALETAEAVGAIIKHLLPYRCATIETVAARMQVSKRTLQRRLRSWGFSFEEILDDIRRTEAIRQVLSGSCSVSETAFLLGYSDPAHFIRAFHRWTEMSTREYVRTFGSDHP
jgi:AraC-like DNA-binding protein